MVDRGRPVPPAQPRLPLPWFESRGHGPAIVLLHGLADTHELWRNQIPVLETRYRTIAVDQYGHGRTPLPPGQLTTAVMADSVAALIDSLGVGRAIVVGLSMGGGVAQVLALRRPDLVRALVLVSTGSDFPPGTKERFLDRADVAERDGMAAVVDATVPRWFTPEFMARHPDEVERTRATVLANDPAAFAAASRANAERGWTDRLDEIGCPVLYVGGEGDPAGPVRSLGVFREHLVDLEATLYPDASHMVPLEVPERFTPLLTGFLERVVERG